MRALFCNNAVFNNYGVFLKFLHLFIVTLLIFGITVKSLQTQPVGCDNTTLGSNLKEDKCRICGGDNSTCRTVEGIFDLDNLQVGYNDILLIPAAATNIRITERYATNNYIAVRNLNGKYYLNGNWRIQFPSQFKFAGSIFHYERKPYGVLAPESLRSIGPISEPIFVVLLYQEKNKGILFEYSLPVGVQSNTSIAIYIWNFGDYGQCSRTCGSGLQIRSVHCSRTKDQVQVPDYLCDPTLRPPNNRTCNTEPCPSEWHIGEWGKCSCHYGVQNRLVYCRIKSDDGTDMIAPDSDCEQLNEGPKPIEIQKCSSDNACANWTMSEWTECDSNCDTGQQTREVNCTLNDETVDESQCDSAVKPNHTQICNDVPCGGVEWIVTEWSPCDVKCGSQIQMRHAYCADENGIIFPKIRCDSDETKIPETTRNCTELPPCEALWHTSEWSSCSAKCGEGLQTRFVFCGHLSDSGQITNDDNDKCTSEKPQETSVCTMPSCDGSWFIGPWGRCTVPCSGGQKSRKVLCLSNENEVIPDSECDASLKPLTKDDCNTHSCDDDQLMAIGGCKDTEFGCCPDGANVTGENYENCSPIEIPPEGCNTTEFGCCKDMTTVAFGPFQKGCPIICNFTRFGCCLDRVTPANSSDLIGCPDFEDCDPLTGCILTTTTTMVSTTIKEDDQTIGVTAGCDTEGSGDSEECAQPIEIPVNCSESAFGCCADGVSIATGDNFEGCEDGSGMEDVFNVTTSTETTTETTTLTDNCTSSQFGCCPDGKTFATGVRYYGCTCEHYPHGCCQDRYTPARGPGFDGCICSRMLYGCCGDGVTPATGPNYEGCSCESSTYGCCPDMVTIARGPNFGGCPCDSLQYGCCPSSSTPATGPNFEGCSCANTPFGCCPDGVKVAYGPKFEECPQGPSLDMKLATEVCALPKERGSCRNYTVKWYFDMQYGGCNRFWYGGCEGNGNRFSSQEQCERSCVLPEGPERCNLPKVVGPCNASYSSWYFNSETKSCEEFLYGGCLGNSNRFESRVNCEQMCIHHEALDQCEQPPNPGPCRGTYPRWYYRKEDGRCKQFIYGGCRGNQNNFQTADECRHSCASQSPQEICSLPKAEGPCLGNFPRWYFEYREGHCKEFVYSGCEGNKNRFVDKTACEKRCNRTVPVSNVDACALPKSEGPCRAAIIQWFYNSEARRCERFYYGGCEGNANRFHERSECETTCIVPVRVGDVCVLPKEQGNCYDYRERWYYDVEDKRCHRFYYSGCSGNENNFGTFQECNLRCGQQTAAPIQPSQEEFKVEYCSKPYDSGPCTKNEIRWFYDTSDGVCKEFLYGGCDGNENRFTSRHECETKCWNSQDICRLEKVRGPCSGRFTQWYYDTSTNECIEFLFSGCHGNANRFNTKESCEGQCKSRAIIANVTTVTPVIGDICQQPSEAGPCRSYLQRWYYSSSDNSCKQFIYGGCDGNSNRFESRKECELRCVQKMSKPEEGPSEQDSNEIVCRQDVDSGSCSETHARWFYDPESYTCLPFVYSGCGGNKNRFKKYETCMRFCSGIQRQPRPAVPSEIKPTEPDVECPPSNCDDLRCPFGVDEFVDERGCSACRCSNPCYIHQCPEDMACAIEVYRAENNEPRAQPICRLRNKPGQCPSIVSQSNHVSTECIDRCRTDADCRGDDKCCNNGCANVCVFPEGIERERTTTSTTPRFIVPYEPYPGGSRDTTRDTEIIVRAGTEVVLDCDQSTYYGRHSSWSREGQPLYFVNEKMRLLENGSLTIATVESEDAGVYACSIDGGRTKYTRLIVQAPARIMSGPQTVIAQLGLPTHLQCNAVGNPDPSVSWWKGQQMLPLNSMQFRQFSNFTLLIRKVGSKDGGIYTCQAYNGIGPIALFDVTLLLDFWSGEPETLPFAPSFNATIEIKDPTEYTVNGGDNRTFVVPLSPDTTLTNVNNNIEPVTAEIRVASHEYKIGTHLQLDCIVRGSQAVVAWFFNGDIPLVADNRHIRILPNNTLMVYNLTPNDAGEYKCLAANQHNEASASVPIRVESTYVPPDCNDSPYFANCDLIVRARYCNNPHYAKFCCRSCLLAGQIEQP